MASSRPFYPSWADPAGLEAAEAQASLVVALAAVAEAQASLAVAHAAVAEVQACIAVVPAAAAEVQACTEAGLWAERAGQVVARWALSVVADSAPYPACRACWVAPGRNPGDSAVQVVPAGAE